MTDLLQPDPSWVRGVRRARWSVAATALAILALALFLGWKDGWFTPVAQFNFQTASSKSLHKGMAVHLSGFKIGQVSRVELQSDRSVRVEMEIYRQYLLFIKTDSEVRIEPDLPLAGDTALEITGGTFRSLNAAPGAALRFRGQPQLYDQVVRVVERLEPMVDNLTQLFNQARQPQGDLQMSLHNLADSTGRLQAWMPGFLERTDAALATIHRAGGTAGDAVTPLARSDGDLQTSLREIRASAAELHEALPAVLADLKAITSSLKNSVTALEPAVNQLSSDLPVLVQQGRQTTDSAGQVVDAVKDFSLIRHKVNQPPQETILPTSKP
ncbi:MAG TPA: MlaD family protein [Candidatus Didemnitutus sp.]|nr:MlaD family protein [Candidatus Didemnitutus sp.]